MAAATLLAASCTDFSDYNEAYQDGLPGSDKTLWENIEERPELSEFASLLTKVGFDKELSKSRFYTVWAPENSTFDFATYDQMDSATLVDRFIMNNVADYNYVVSSPESKRLAVLNEKVYTMQNENGITFANNDIVVPNIPSSNGTLHITQGAALYLPSIYEYIFDQKEAGVDTAVADYLEKYQNVYLDVENSVVGPIDTLGQQTYIDSVMVTINTMTTQLGAYIDEEDSMYTMLMPTDEAYKKAYDADPTSIFGGIVAANREIDKETAEMIHSIFIEIVVAPSFSKEALEILSQKANIRLLKLPTINAPIPENCYDMKKVLGGLLVQQYDRMVVDMAQVRTVTKKEPTNKQMDDMVFAMKVVKHTKSNAIVIARDGVILGIGCGQVNRIRATEQAIAHSLVDTKGAVLASDAFFPFDDCARAAAKAGITAIMQPGGSIKDQLSIDACDENGVAMVFTGDRHFKH